MTYQQKPERKVVQIAAIPSSDIIGDVQILVLCDDGSMYVRRSTNEFFGWHQVPPIPQDGSK